MRRRPFLATLLTAGGSFVAGCSDRVSTGTMAEATTPSSATDSTLPPESTRTGSAEGSDCPPLGPSMLCHGRSNGASLALVPSTETASLAGETIGFSLRNRSDGRVSFDPFGWQLWGESNGTWNRVDRSKENAEATSTIDRPSVGETVLNPGGSYAWQIAIGPVTVEADRPPVTINGIDFDPGRYALAVPLNANGGTTCVAPFRVTG